MQRIACLEWSRKLRTYGPAVHVYELERPGSESASAPMARLRLTNRVRDLTFTHNAEYVLAIFGDPPSMISFCLCYPNIKMFIHILCFSCL